MCNNNDQYIYLLMIMAQYQLVNKFVVWQYNLYMKRCIWPRFV